MTVCRNDDRWDRSNVVFRDGRIVRYDKQVRTPDMPYIDYGLGVFRHTAFVGRHQHEPEAFDLVAVYQRLVKNEDLAGFEVSGRFYEIGSPAGLDEARAYLAGKG
jgi:NDP-sugar pyrophosphorylase family protein